MTTTIRDPVFRAIAIGSMTLQNRILRSSIGGKSCNFDGTVTDVWKNFERRFALGGVAGVISTTFHVDQDRMSPAQYPSIATDRHMRFLRKFMPEIKGGPYDCKYIVQIGDPGYVTYSSLFPQSVDGLSASAGFDLGFGYVNARRAMSDRQIERAIDLHIAAAARVREAGADGVEITASKGYLIHQFLNPAINRRNDDWGGTPEKRFQFLKRILTGVRARVGLDFPVGVRLSGEDFNGAPWPLALGRWPSPFLSRERRIGNDISQMKAYAKSLEELGADYLHVTAGFGFPNPRDVPGRFPFEEVRMFFDSVRHLSTKAAIRAAITHVGPLWAWDWLLNRGWRDDDAPNLGLSKELKSVVHIPIIANGGFREVATIRGALQNGGCHMVSMARALIATPDFVLDHLRSDVEVPAGRRCTHCNRCVGRTATSPLGCYEPSRFDYDIQKMEHQILAFNAPDEPHDAIAPTPSTLVKQADSVRALQR